MALNFQVDEATAAQRRFPLYLVDAADGITAETGEAAGQPQLSKNGAAFANTSATLTAIGNGSYYVELTAGELDTLGMVTIRYKSAATAEFSLTGQVVSYDPYSATNLGLTNLDTTISSRSDFDETANPVEILDSGGAAGTSAAELVDDLWNEDIVAAHGGADSSGLLLRALGALISQRGNNPTLNALLGVPDAAGDDLSETVWAEGTRDLTALGFQLASGDFAAGAIDAAAIATDAIDADAISADAKAELFGALGVVGTADAGGNTTTIRDAALTQADDFFNGHLVLFTSGTNNGRVVRCIDFLSATDDLVFAPAVGVAVGAGDTYIILGSAFAQVDVQTWLNSVVNALVSGAVDADVSAMQPGVVTAAAIATDAVDADALAADAVDEIVDQVWDELIAGHLGVGSTGEALNGASAPSAADNADAVWDEDIVAAHGGADSAGLLLRALGALISQRANNPTLNALLGVADAVGEDVPSTVTDEVWDEDATPHQAAGSFGGTIGDQAADPDSIFGLANTNLDATVSSRSDFDETTDPVELLDAGGAIGTSAAELVDDIWDEAQAGHVGAGTFGLFLDAVVSGRAAAGDAMALTAAAVDDIWDEDIVAAHGGGDSAGLLLRALGALISQRANNATLEELLGVADAVGRDIPEQIWLEGTRDLTALGFQLDTADFVAAFLDATLIAANAIGASQLATDAGQEIADRILARSLATGADGGRTVQDALRLLRNLRQIVAGVLTVMEEDDVTPAWTAAVTTAAGDPVDSIDPT